MKTVEDCPCSKLNEHYPYEGNMTKHKCLIAQIDNICDGETAEGCSLFEAMKENEDLRKLLQDRFKKGE